MIIYALFGLLITALLALMVDGQMDEISFMGSVVMIVGTMLLLVTTTPQLFGG